MKLGIIREFNGKHKHYVEACKELKLNYSEIDIISSNWIDNVRQANCNGFLVWPSCDKDSWKRLYDERLYFINRHLDKPIYPSYDELFIYENKRNMAYWLAIKNITGPKTWIYYDISEALDFIKQNEQYPLIFKPNIGSSSLGIKIVKNRKEATRLINRIFTRYKFYNIGYTKWKKTRFGISYPVMDDVQFNNILFQEMISVKHEWRGVKIGKSFFAHKKLMGKKGFHSGSGLACYENPPISVMNFIKNVCDVGKFRSMDVDFFEDYHGNFYVNELQAVFGSRIQLYQMCVNGKPGRYVYTDEKWVFETGDFNRNNSCNLRVEDFIEVLKARRDGI